MKQFQETYKSMGHVTSASTTGIVTPSKHTAELREKLCACGTKTYGTVCAVCKCAREAGLDLRVFRKKY